MDPTTLVGFGENLSANIGNGFGRFGLSPLYVNVDPIKSSATQEVRYSPGGVQLAPFAIAASDSSEASQLAAWFDLARSKDSQASRTVKVRLTGHSTEGVGTIDGELLVTIDDCSPTALDSDFAGVVRVVVDCLAISEIEIDESTSAALVCPNTTTTLLLEVNNGYTQTICDVSGGGERVVGGRVEIVPLRARTGFESGQFFNVSLSMDGIEQWIRDALNLTNGSSFRNVTVSQLVREPMESLVDIVQYRGPVPHVYRPARSASGTGIRGDSTGIRPHDASQDSIDWLVECTRQSARTGPGICSPPAATNAAAARYPASATWIAAAKSDLARSESSRGSREKNVEQWKPPSTARLNIGSASECCTPRTCALHLPMRPSPSVPAYRGC